MEEGRETGSWKKEISLSRKWRSEITRRTRRREKSLNLMLEKKKAAEKRRIINSQHIARRLNKQWKLKINFLWILDVLSMCLKSCELCTYEDYQQVWCDKFWWWKFGWMGKFPKILFALSHIQFYRHFIHSSASTICSYIVFHILCVCFWGWCVPLAGYVRQFPKPKTID